MDHNPIRCLANFVAELSGLVSSNAADDMAARLVQTPLAMVSQLTVAFLVYLSVSHTLIGYTTCLGTKHGNVLPKSDLSGKRMSPLQIQAPWRVSVSDI
jgi:hypothetical protein